MHTRLKHFKYFFMIALVISLATAAEAQTRAYYVTERQVQTVLDRIETRTDVYKQQMNRFLDNSNIDGTRREDSISTMIDNFERATDDLKTNFASRRSTASDVQEVLTRGAFIDRFMRNSRASTMAKSQWNLIRTDLNTLAGYYRVQADWNATTNYPVGQNVYTVADADVRTLLARIETGTDTFKLQIARNLDRSSVDGTNREESINTMVANFESATDRLRANFSSRRSTAADVSEVLNRAVGVNNFVQRSRLSRAAESQWTSIRTDLDTLASYYRVASNWNTGPVLPVGPIGGGAGSFDNRITGTYRLNSSLSDNLTTVVGRAVSTGTATNQDRTRRNLERRLASPETLTLEKQGQQVTMSSANGAAITLDADGVARTETSPNGRTVRTTVTATNRDLTISYDGDRMNDFNVVFAPQGNGQLRVTRRVYLENQNETVTATSVYDKTSQVPSWNTAAYPADTGSGNDTASGFLIPNNTGLVATLDTPLSTKASQDGDRFTMTVTSPSQYRDAVIEGRVVTQKSGVVSGRANISLSFDTIRMRNGQTYRFAGIVDQVRDTNGNVITVNNEGAVRDDSQTTKTVTRAGIGAALGALIGAIAGGGKGAAIGAGVGAGAGAGTVILQGRDNLDLSAGSQFTITATGPASVGAR